MPELATKADIDELRRMVQRQTFVLTIWLGSILVVGMVVIAFGYYHH